MRHRPAVAVTATTKIIDGALRTRANVAYTDALVNAGLRPYVLPVLGPEEADAMLDGMAGLVLTGGEDVDPARYGQHPHAKLGGVHPGRDAFEIALLHAARERSLPTLAICRGMQLANVALGGTLVQDIPSEWPGAIAHDGSWARNARVHELSIVPDARLAWALGATTVTVNSFHHQAVAREGDGLRIVARAPDGVIEGFEWSRDDWWMLGVQWHPEETFATAEPWDHALFAAFASAAGLSAGVASGLRS